MPSGRYAPSPTGSLHVGNLRTAVVAWLLARRGGDAFHLRIDDLDTSRVSARAEARQVHDLQALGIEWDGVPLRQSARLDRYREALKELDTYECFCSRADIRRAASAPHAADLGGRYPGTCASLSAEQRARRRRERPAALRVRADGQIATATDRWKGTTSAPVDDVVVQRNDGTPAYHLATVVDDAELGVGEVCRGDDLWPATPTQVWLAHQCGLHAPDHAHVGLVVNTDGDRLAKRDGAVTLDDLGGVGVTATDVLSWIAHTLGVGEPGEPVTLLALLDQWSGAEVSRVTFPSPPWAHPNA